MIVKIKSSLESLEDKIEAYLGKETKKDRKKIKETRGNKIRVNQECTISDL